MLRQIRWAWRAFLYPMFDCTDCSGSIRYGCECLSRGAVAPGIGPEPWREWLREWTGDLVWIKRVWRHWQKARRAEYEYIQWAQSSETKYPYHLKHYQSTAFWDCVGATIAILLHRHDERLCDWNTDYYVEDAVAWGEFGTYETDYGTGRSWDALYTARCRFCISSDGSL